MRAAMTSCNRSAAVKRAARICLVAVAAMGAAQLGLMPWLDPRGRLLLSAVVASLASQGIVLMLIVSFGRLRFVTVRRRARRFGRVRNPWYPPGVAIKVPVGG